MGTKLRSIANNVIPESIFDTDLTWAYKRATSRKLTGMGMPGIFVYHLTNKLHCMCLEI